MCVCVNGLDGGLVRLEENTMQNILLTSMYFFVPLEKVKQEYIMDFEENKNKIDYPLYAKHVKDEVFYRAINKFGKDFFIKLPKYGETPYKVHVNLFLVGYRARQDKEWTYYVVVGTDFGHLLQTANGETSQLVTEHDIISLKIAFTSRERDNIAPMICDGQAFSVWFENIIRQISDDKYVFLLYYSLTDIRTATIDDNKSGNEVIETFANKFFDNEPIEITNTLGEDYPRLAYGLLHAHDNYQYLDSKEISEKQKHFYSDLVSERFYSAEGSILFLRTHYPFKYPQNDKHKFLNEEQYFDFKTLPNILEMCIAVSKNQKLNKWRKIVSQGKEPTEMRKAISDMTKELNKYHFHIYELDNKIWFIDESWSFYDMFNEISVLGEQHAVSLSIKETLMVSRVTLGIAAVTCLLTLFNIILLFLCN